MDLMQVFGFLRRLMDQPCCFSFAVFLSVWFSKSIISRDNVALLCYRHVKVLLNTRGRLNVELKMELMQ